MQMRTETIRWPADGWVTDPPGYHSREEALRHHMSHIPLGTPMMQRLVLPSGCIRWRVVTQISMRVEL